MNKSIIHDVDSHRRKAIVSRTTSGGGVTRVIAAECTNEAELAYAIRFLLDHFTYKHSKSKGVNAKAIQSAARAATEALGNYADEVAEPMGVDLTVSAPAEHKVATPVVSELGSGKVKNPFSYV